MHRLKKVHPTKQNIDSMGEKRYVGSCPSAEQALGHRQGWKQSQPIRKVGPPTGGPKYWIPPFGTDNTPVNQKHNTTNIYPQAAMAKVGMWRIVFTNQTIKHTHLQTRVPTLRFST
jgi:hypothetical protein